MSSRARKLAEIAKANEPAFLENLWWLEDGAPKKEPPKPEAPTPAVLEPQPVAVVSHLADGKLAVAETPEVVFHPAPIAPQVQSVVVQPAAELQIASQPVESNPEPLPSIEPIQRIGGLREKFLWLGRKKRAGSRE